MIGHILENREKELIATAISFSMKSPVTGSQIKEINECIMSGEIDIEAGGNTWSDYNETGSDILYFGRLIISSDQAVTVTVQLGSKNVCTFGVSSNELRNPFEEHLFSDIDIKTASSAAVSYQFVGYQIRFTSTGSTELNSQPYYSSNLSS